MHTLLTLALFATALVLVLLRPRGWHEAWWTSAGAIAAIACGLITPSDAWAAVWSARDALIFLLALLLLTALVEQSGFFEWAAVHSARAARGSGHALFRNVFLLGAAITASLSLDTTAVMLTPLVLAFVLRLRLPPEPYVIACAFVSNAGSLLLPISNLTNLLYLRTIGDPPAVFFGRMFVPQLVTLGVLYLGLRIVFRKALPERFDESQLGDARAHIHHVGYFRVTCFVLPVVLVGYVAGPAIGVPASAVAFLGAATLAAVGMTRASLGLGWLRSVPFGLFPFVAGLFVLVRCVEMVGVPAPAIRWFESLGHGPGIEVLAAAGVAGFASNVINNLPAALMVKNVLLDAHAGAPAFYGALLGTNIGPNVTLFGSLATMLVIAAARRRGVDVTSRRLLAVGAAITPPVLLAAALALWLTYVIVPPR